jgi:hypothetical protein
MVNECSAFFAYQGKLSQLPDCNATYPTGQPVFPTTNCNNASQNIGPFPPLPLVLSYRSHFLSLSPVVPYSQADCPFPLKFNPHGSIADSTQSLSNPHQICVYPCPDPMFTDAEWDGSIGALTGLGSTSPPSSSLSSPAELYRQSQIATFIIVLIRTRLRATVVSFSIVLFLIITYSLMRHKRRFPTSFTIWLCVSSLICSVGVLVPVLVGGTLPSFQIRQLFLIHQNTQT